MLFLYHIFIFLVDYNRVFYQIREFFKHFLRLLHFIEVRELSDPHHEMLHALLFLITQHMIIFISVFVSHFLIHSYVSQELFPVLSDALLLFRAYILRIELLYLTVKPHVVERTVRINGVQLFQFIPYLHHLCIAWKDLIGKL